MTIEDAVAAILRGGVIAIPTETVYGLACNPADPLAVERVYALKRRPPGLELTLLAAGRGDIEDEVAINETAERCAAAFWPGPLSMVLQLRRRSWAIPRAGTTLSVRVPDHALLHDLLRRTGPLASTSANRHGEPPATDAAAVAAALGAEVDAILDGGPAGGQPSTIIDCTTTPPRVLREGPVDSVALRSLLEGTATDARRGSQ